MSPTRLDGKRAWSQAAATVPEGVAVEIAGHAGDWTVQAWSEEGELGAVEESPDLGEAIGAVLGPLWEPGG